VVPVRADSDVTGPQRRTISAFRCDGGQGVGEFRKGFAPLVKIPPREIKAILVGLIGAADALTAAAAAGRMSRADAVSALSRIMSGAFTSATSAR
jgi:hypothetical protein